MGHGYGGLVGSAVGSKRPVIDVSEARAAVVDVAFEIRGDRIPRYHRAALAEAIAQVAPLWRDLRGTGVHRLNTCGSTGADSLLARRTRLLLRVPRDDASAVADALDGGTLEVGGARLLLGRPQVRELVPWSTLYAHLVVAERPDEVEFIAAVREQVDAIGVSGRVICGRRQQVDGGELSGYSLMIDQVEPSASLRLMERGLGRHQQWGCGVFVPHKSAAAVGAGH